MSLTEKERKCKRRARRARLLHFLFFVCRGRFKSDCGCTIRYTRCLFGGFYKSLEIFLSLHALFVEVKGTNKKDYNNYNCSNHCSCITVGVSFIFHIIILYYFIKITIQKRDFAKQNPFFVFKEVLPPYFIINLGCFFFHTFFYKFSFNCNNIYFPTSKLCCKTNILTTLSNCERLLFRRHFNSSFLFIFIYDNT